MFQLWVAISQYHMTILTTHYTMLLIVMAIFALNTQSKAVFTLEDWQYDFLDQGIYHPTKVPKTLSKILQELEIVKQPYYYRDNFLSYYQYQTNNITYQTTISQQMVYQCSHSKIKQLIFEGLDTHCDVSLNGQKILQAHNMYRQYKVQIDTLIDGQDNTLKVRCNSSVTFDLQEQSRFRQQFGFTLPQNFSFTRKAAYQYGWDWGPRILTVGIWKPVKFRCFDEITIKRTYLNYPAITFKNPVVENVEAVADFEDLIPGHEYQIEIMLTQNDSIFYKQTQKFIPHSPNHRFLSKRFSFNQSASNSLIWWTWDLGQPNLFNFTVTVQEVNFKTIETGFRTVKLVQNKDANGTSFSVNLNGYDVFMRGGNYIPPSMEMSDLQSLKKKYKQVRQQALFAKYNMIRVWGGGHYENDEFYTEMDQAGILIWHDLMFACALYPIFGNFSTIQNIKAEIKDNVGRIGYHPSIGLWNGNNEVWIGWQEWGWQNGLNKTQKQQVQQMYRQIFHEAIPEVISDLTPDIFYWETSPSSSSNSLETLTSGDIHFWRVWGAGKPIEQYQTYIGRFNSEYGIQSMPQYSSILKFTQASDLQINSFILRLHERHPKGDQYLPMYTESICEPTKDLKRYSYFTQIMQSYALEMAIRSLRGAKPYCMGSLYWQLNDVWPVSSWSTVDYYGAYKASHYRIRHAYSQLYTHVFHAQQQKQYIIYVTNDYLEKRYIECQVKIIDVDGTIRKQSHFKDNVDGLDIKKITKITSDQLSEYQLNRTFINMKVTTTGMEGSESNYFFTSPKSQFLLIPNLSYTFIGGNLVLKTKFLANYIWIKMKNDEPLHLDENYFDMIPNSEKLVKMPTGVDHSLIEVTCYQYQVITSIHENDNTIIVND